MRKVRLGQEFSFKPASPKALYSLLLKDQTYVFHFPGNQCKDKMTVINNFCLYVCIIHSIHKVKWNYLKESTALFFTVTWGKSFYWAVKNIPAISKITSFQGLFLFNYLFIHLLLVVLGLRCWVLAFSSCSEEQGLPFIVVCGLLIVVPSLVAVHRL